MDGEAIITKLIANKNGIESATEYKVDFARFKAIFYHVEVRLIKPSPPHD